MRKNVKNFEAVSMLEPVFVNGELVYEPPKLEEIRAIMMLSWVSSGRSICVS